MSDLREKIDSVLPKYDSLSRKPDLDDLVEIAQSHTDKALEEFAEELKVEYGKLNKSLLEQERRTQVSRQGILLGIEMATESADRVLADRKNHG